MTLGIGKLAWAVAAILLAISLIELAGGDFASAVGLLVVFVVLWGVLRRLKVKWQPKTTNLTF